MMSEERKKQTIVKHNERPLYSKSVIKNSKYSKEGKSKNTAPGSQRVSQTDALRVSRELALKVGLSSRRQTVNGMNTSKEELGNALEQVSNRSQNVNGSSKLAKN